jgi:hypothetical protein
MYIVQTLNTEPLIQQIDNWLTADEMNCILKKSIDWVPGKTRRPDGSFALDPLRQCVTKRIDYGQDPDFDRITHRVAEFFGVNDVMCIEPMPLVQYRTGDYFLWHSDLTRGFSVQRRATVVMYLNDNFAGGYTHFKEPKITVKPVRGNALVFHYNTDCPMIHCGAPVTHGTKYILTAFVREGIFTSEDRKLVRY